MLCLPRCSRWHWLDPRICSDLFLQLPGNTLPGTIIFHTVDRVVFFSRSADAFSPGNQTVDFLTIQFLCLFLNYFFPDKSALKLTLLALFPASALAPTLSWAALGTKCLGTREDGIEGSHLDVVWEKAYRTPPFFGGKAWKKRGKNMVYAWSAADFPLSLPSDLRSARTAGLRFRLLCNIVVPSPGTDASKVN